MLDQSTGILVQLLKDVAMPCAHSGYCSCRRIGCGHDHDTDT